MLVNEQKRALRAKVREGRRLLSDAELRTAASGVSAQLNALVDSRDACSISCFLSAATEPGTRDFVRTAAARGIRVLLPISRADGLLDWAVADDTENFAEGMFALDEPAGETLGTLAVHDVDLMIIPAAAVDSAGVRLGWGRGYFDKTIAAMTDCPPIYAVTYDSEILDDLPREAHDQPVTGVVTPTRILTLPLTRH